MMFKVLVVDDETLIKEGIAEGIDWDKLECDMPYLADNGLEAVDIIKNYDIDIVITDIKMPGMNGLELAEWICQNREGIYVIILSGYDDFKFAQNALSYGVTEYILKPTKLDEVENSIEKVKSKVKEKNKIIEAYNKSRDVLKYSNKQAIIDNYIFNRVSTNTEGMKYCLENVEHDMHLHMLIILQVYNHSRKFLEKSNYFVEYIKYIEEFIKSCLEEKCIDVLIQYEKDEILIYLSSDSSLLSEEGFSNAADRLILELKRKTNEFIPFDMVIGTSHIGKSISSLKKMYCDAIAKCDAEKQRVLFEQDSIIENKNLKDILNLDFKSHLQNRNYQIIMNDVEEVFQKFLDKPEAYVKGIAIELINYTVLCLGEKTLTGNMDMQSIYEEIVKSYERKQIAHIVKDTMKQMCLYMDATEEYRNDGNELIERITKYIRRNFFNDLSLESVAEQFYISPGHLSRLIRKNCNMTFLEILTRVRIENAKILLKNPKFKAYEVGTMIGFNDSKYFSQVFKKYTGKTPSEFK